jgi:hypothetical protein
MHINHDFEDFAGVNAFVINLFTITICYILIFVFLTGFNL